MPHFVELHLKPQFLARYDLPDIAYPLPADGIQDALSKEGNLPLAAMLLGLQQQSGNNPDFRQKIEPAMERLTLLLAPDDTREVISIAGDQWWLEVGPVDLCAKLVTIQRCDKLIAALSPTKDGRLRVAVFRPLDAKSASYMVGLAQTPHPEGGVCMRENNWEYALDCSAGNGNHYASARGEAYLSYWEKGIGISNDGSDIPIWRAQNKLSSRRPSLVATEIGVHYSFSSEEDGKYATKTAADPDLKPAPTATHLEDKYQQAPTTRERFLGCLIGGAVGDALGAPIEFMPRTRIIRRFGPSGITQFAPAYGGLGRITDDTQMTLFTAEGLLRAWVRGCFKGTTDYAGVTAHAYLRWLKTQGVNPTSNIEFGTDEPGWLFQQHLLHSQRAPGNTCISALRVMRVLGEPANNESKGCGGVMRVAPAGLFSFTLGHQESPQYAFQLGTTLSALTHGHETGSLTGGTLAALIQLLAAGVSLGEALVTSKALLQQQNGHEETLRAIEMAEKLAASEQPHETAITQLGNGWVAEEALAISIYCALVASDFRQGVILAVNHDGDSDSTGSITGNLLGVMHGLKSIPDEWLEPLELHDVITELAQDLYSFRDWEIGEHSNNNDLNQQIWQKYPGF